MANLSTAVNVTNSNGTIARPVSMAVLLFNTTTTFCIGAIGLVCSLFVAVVIFSSKPLRTPCFKLIGGSAIGSVLVAAHYFGRGLDNIGALTGTMLPVQRSVLVCLLTAGMQGMFGIPYHCLVTCLVGVDRIFSLVKPIKYRSFGNRYVIYMLLGVATLVFIVELIGFLTAPLQKVVTCKNFPEVTDQGFTDVFGFGLLFFDSISVAIYVAMLFFFYNRKAKLQEGSHDQRNFMKQQSSAMPTVRFMIILYFICGMVPDTMIIMALQFDRNVYQAVDILRAIGGLLKTCCSLIEFISLMVFSERFRQCAKIRLGINPNKVAASPAVLSGPGAVGAAT